MRSAVRSLWRRPMFAITAVLTIALAIGANTALFSVIYSILLRPLPFRDPGKLVQIWETHPTLKQLQVTVPDFEDWKKQSQSFEQIAGYTQSAMNTGTLLGHGDPVSIHATMASANLFPMMGIQPLAGRPFNDSEDAGKQRVALLSESLWRRKFNANPAIVGQQIRFDTQSFQVLGIVPQQQAYPEWSDMWIPLSLIEPGLRNARKFHPLEVIARLNPGVTPERAQSEMVTIARNLSQAHPATNATISAYVSPLQQELTRSVRPYLLLAWAAVGLVLLIACANLAHLTLARMIERRQEIAIRESLGARPAHLIRQLLGESVLIAMIGGVAGVVLAACTRRLVQQIPGATVNLFDGPVWLFVAVITLLAGLLFGLPACWQVLRPDVRLTATGRAVVGTRSRFSNVLMACEVALALLVLSGAALLTRSFVALLNEDPGFRAQQVWAIPNLPLRSDWDQSAQFLTTRLTPALGRTPGVVAVAAVNSAPVSLSATDHSRFATRFGIAGRTFDAGGYPVAQNRWITPEYFQVLSIPIESGRGLSENDRNQPRLLVNQALARRFFPGQDPVGKRLILGVMNPTPQLNEIVGVVGDVRDLGLDQEAVPTLYGIATSPVMTLLVKTASGSNQNATALRDAIAAVDPEIPVTKVHPLQQNVVDSLARRRFALILLSIFGAMSALMTAGGIYGLLTQSVNARLREFGVRAAVGASPPALITMILREAGALTLPGLILGAALSLAFARVMKSFVYQLSPTDPISIGGAAVFLVLLTFLSSWLPARRAAAVDPAQALRAD